MIVGIRQSIMTVSDKCHVMLKNFMLPMRCMTKIDGAERESWHLMQLWECGQKVRKVFTCKVSKVQHDSSRQLAFAILAGGDSKHVNDWHGDLVASVCLLISTAAAASSSSLPHYPPLPPLQGGQSNFDSQPEQTSLNWWVSISRIFLLFFKYFGSISKLRIF